MKLSHVLFGAGAALMAAGMPAIAADYGCNNETISGAYAAHATGVSGTAAPFAPVAFAATRLFDGKGHFSGAGYQSTGGVAVKFSTSGTYSVAPDCTVTITGTLTTGGLNLQFGVIADRSNHIYTTRTDKGNTIQIDYERLFTK